MFTKGKSIKNSFFKPKSIKRGRYLLVGTGLVTASLVLTSTALAYGDESKTQPKVENKKPEDLETTRREILARVAYIAEMIGIPKEELVKQVFPHLTDSKKFADVLATHRKIEGKILREKGTSVFIDHTVLAANTTAEQIDTLCAEAITNKFAAVCVEGGRVLQAVNNVKETNIKTAAVVGFPLGAMSAQSKAAEALEYAVSGVDEIDMVIDIGRIKDRDYDYVFHDVSGVARNLEKFWWKKNPPILKVILECCLLTREEIIDASILCALANVQYIKTSTGFSTHGATEEHVRLMKLTVGNKILVKAAGGVRDKKALVSMVYQGASRIGTSSGTKLVLNASDASTELKELESRS